MVASNFRQSQCHQTTKVLPEIQFYVFSNVTGLFIIANSTYVIFGIGI